MELHKSWMYLWIVVSFFVCSMVTAGWWFENQKIIEMAKQGYEERTVPGRQAFAWQKVR